MNEVVACKSTEESGGCNSWRGDATASGVQTNSLLCITSTGQRGPKADSTLLGLIRVRIMAGKCARGNCSSRAVQEYELEADARVGGDASRRLGWVPPYCTILGHTMGRTLSGSDVPS